MSNDQPGTVYVSIPVDKWDFLLDTFKQIAQPEAPWSVDGIKYRDNVIKRQIELANVAIQKMEETK
jgi:hypothetical protein